MARAILDFIGAVRTFTGDGGIDPGGEIDRTVSGIQAGAIRGIFPDWDAAEYFRGDYWRSYFVEGVPREFGFAVGGFI